MLNKIKALEAKLEEQRLELEAVHAGMHLFNLNFQAMGKALEFCAERVKALESKPKSHTMTIVK